MNKLIYLRLPVTKWTYRSFGAKASDFTEGYATGPHEVAESEEKESHTWGSISEKDTSFGCTESKINHFNTPSPTYGFKREVVPSDFNSDKRNRNGFHWEDEKWFSRKLSSEENYQDLNNIVNEDGHGKNMFFPKYGNSFWDPQNHN